VDSQDDRWLVAGARGSWCQNLTCGSSRALDVGDDPDALDEDTPMTLILGPDRTGNRLEVAALVADGGAVVHAC
jgi:hypothetical protein